MDECNEIKKIIGKTFLEISEAIKTGKFEKNIKIGLTTLGSEHGLENLLKGAEIIAGEEYGIDVVLIGPKISTNLEVVEANTEDEMYKIMEELLDSGYISGCVTMHYNFPIGVSTVGKVITPGLGKEMFIGTTTGTASANRVEAMIRNALYGIIVAKATGNENPTVGILNLDGSRQVEKALKKLDSNGYKINFAESMRSDGGTIMRGNDLLNGTADVMVTDTLTGNILMKMFSSYTTGGNYESLGYGYGPGIGEDYKRNILIISRASGTPVVANAIRYAAKLAKGNITDVAKEEFESAKKAKLNDILNDLTKVKKEDKASNDNIIAPPKEVVTGSLSGIDIMDLEDAVMTLWKMGVYAESGMGCTGPIILLKEENLEKARNILIKAEYLIEN